MPQNVKTPQVLQDSPNVPESVQKGTNLILAKAATCGHLLWRPLAATCGHLLWRPLAATCGHSIGCGCKWLQVVADEKRMRAETGGHWLAATRLAASGCKWLPMRRECWWPLAATCGHSIGCKWLQVAAAEKRMLADTGGHWRPLDWLLLLISPSS